MNNNLLLITSALCLSATATHATQKDHPNIILIYCDDMGYGDLGITGHPNIKTPNLDKMALAGTRFTNYYSASPASTASRYAMLTGKYAPRSGFGWVIYPKDKRGIHPNEITQAEAAKAQGYKTAIFGKWHLGSIDKKFLPLQNGFDEYVGLPYSNDMIPPKWQDIALMNGNDTITMNPDQRMLTELYTDKAIDFIKRNKKEKFFLYIPYAMPHVPLHPGKAFAGKSKRGKYGDVVEEIDYHVGRVLKQLKKLKLDKNTIVWFISDNGPWIIKGEEGGSSGLFRDGKGSTWEGGVRVPCIAYCPGLIPANHINEDVVCAMDVYATNLWLTGYELPKDHVTDGQNIASALGYDIAPKPATPYFYFGVNHQLMAVRSGKWKLHIKTYSQTRKDYFNGKLPLLFNLETDPSEKHDVAAKHPEVVAELNQMLKEKMEEVKRTGSLYDIK